MHKLTHTYIGTFWHVIHVMITKRILGPKTLVFGLCVLCVLWVPHVSHAQVTLSGTVYSDAGITADGVVRNISVAVGTSTPSVFSTTSAVTTGAWTVTIPVGHSISTSTPILVWLDNDVTKRGEVLTKSDSSQSVFSITGLDLYRDRVIVRHEATSGTSTTLADFSFYTSVNDTDVQHSTSTGLLAIAPGNELYIWAGKTFAPNSAVTVHSNATASSTDGSVYIGATGVYIAGGNLTLGGSLTAVSTATFTGGFFSTIFNATTTGKIINAPIPTLGNLTFNGVGGGWTFTSAATTSALTILRGTVVAPSTTLGVTGVFQNDATFTHNGGTVTIAGAASEALGDIAVYAVGRDASGSAAGTVSVTINSYALLGNYLYVGKAGGGTACNQTAGSVGAGSCELMVFDVSSTTNPTYVAGRDVLGDAAGLGNLPINTLAVVGNYLYVGKATNGTACSNTPGSALGCELMVFDISSGTNPIYVAGRDTTGAAAGTDATTAITSITSVGNYLFVAKTGSGTACSNTVGSAVGCELMVFDISSSTNPTYVVGRDTLGSAGGTGNSQINQLEINGNNLYLVKAANGTACSNTPGSALGCELMVFDISSSTNPTYVVGRDATGAAAGTANLGMSSLEIKGTYLYIGKSGDFTTCSQSVGSALGCELMVFDISSTTNPIYVRGVDVGGSYTGNQILTINNVLISGNYLYATKAASALACSQFTGRTLGCELAVFDISSSTAVRLISGRDAGGDKIGLQTLGATTLFKVGNTLYVAKGGSTSACNQSAGSAVGCELMGFDITRTGSGILAGTFGGSNALNHVVASGVVEFRDNASLTNLTISSGTTTAPAILQIAGNYTNAANFLADSGMLMVSSTVAQTVSGDLLGANAPYSLVFGGTGTKTISSNVVTTFLEIKAGTSVVAPTLITVSDTFINNGTYSATGSSLTTTGFLNEFSAGVSAGGSGSDAIGVAYTSLVTVGTTLYAGKAANNTGCTQVAGTATGCELMVFNIASATNPIFVNSRDAAGSINGVGNIAVSALATAGNTLYVGKGPSAATACNPVIGSAIDCELMVFDISSTTNPTFVTARDSSGNSASTSIIAITSLAVSGNYLYVGKAGSATACSQTSGFAAGCEIMIFDISSTTNPQYIAGQDVIGSTTGTGNVAVTALAVTSSALYVTKAGNPTTCNEGEGNGVGCELMVFDVSSSTNPSYVTGRDAHGFLTNVLNVTMTSISILGNRAYIGKAGSGTACNFFDGTGCEIMIFDISSTTNPLWKKSVDATGAFAGNTGNLAVNTVVATGSVLYVGKSADSTACSQTAGSALGCELMVFDVSSSTNPEYIKGLNSDSTKVGQSLITVQALSIQNDNLLVAKALDTTVCEQGIGLRTGCELMFFKIPTTVSGNLTGSSSLTNVTTNGLTTISSAASTTNITIATSSSFIAPASKISVSGNLIINGNFIHNNGEVVLQGSNQLVTANATTTFYDFTNVATAAATTTFSTNAPFVVARNLTLTGASISNRLRLRSASTSVQWQIDPQSSSTISATYLDVRDSNNISTTTTLLPCSAVCTDSGNNTNWSFVSVGLGTGSSSLAQHTSGQTTNKFSAQNQVNESLLAFRIIPTSGTTTISSVTFVLSGAVAINPSNFSNIRLFIDSNNNGLYNGSDIQVSDAGVMTLGNNSGTIAFTESFIATTSHDYILVADFVAPSNGSFLTFSLSAGGIVSVDGTGIQTIFGAALSIQHSRNNKGAGGGGSSSVGGPAPAGAGDIGGGGSVGGELIGSHPDFFWPSAHLGPWNSGANAYDQTDSTYATTSSAVNQSYLNHGFAVPGANTVSGIEVKIELSGSTAAGTASVELSWDGGTSWTSAKNTPTLTTNDTVRTLGSLSDLWGRTWSPSEFSNANFALRLAGNPSSNTIQVDAIQVRVYHISGGGGSGGGGAGGGI